LAPARPGREWRHRFSAIQTDAAGLQSSEDLITKDEEGSSRGNGLLED
jgi:hypothetical protein